MKLSFSQQIFEKYSYIKFHENLSSGNQTFPCRHTDEQTDITKLIVAFTILRMHLKMKNLCLASTILRAPSIIGREKLIKFQTP